jgi:uncharacterized damage-inducible protein DinB
MDASPVHHEEIAVTAAEGLLSALEWNWTMVDTALEGLDDTIWVRRPAEQCNSIAWILWHMNRVMDTFIHARLQSQPQLWIRDSWYQQFGMGDDPEDRGVRWTPAQVAAWTPPSKTVQMGYYGAVKQATRAFLPTLSAADLEMRRIIPPTAEPRTVAAALGQVTWDHIAHGGQIAYLRGLFEGMGWYNR